MSIGEFLKQERVARKVSLREIQSITKIPLRYLEDLEAGNLHMLPKIYVRGYIKAYSDCMDLVVPEMLLQTRELIDEKPQEIFEKPTQKSPFSISQTFIYVAIAAIVIALAAYFAWK